MGPKTCEECLSKDGVKIGLSGDWVCRDCAEEQRNSCSDQTFVKQTAKKGPTLFEKVNNVPIKDTKTQ